MLPLFVHPFSLIIAGPSNCGKSTLAFELIKNSRYLVEKTDSGGFDAVFVLYRSMQPLYTRLQTELDIPVFLFQHKLPEKLEVLLQGTKHPIILIDDGITPQNQDLVRDLFCRLGHHLGISVILITQSLFDSKNDTLRLCHRNTKGLIVFGCPRDLGSLRTLIWQMMPDRKKGRQLLQEIESVLETPYRYCLFDFQPSCPANQRFKTNIVGETEYPIAFVFSVGNETA